jgi:hypothetical protein
VQVAIAETFGQLLVPHRRIRHSRIGCEDIKFHGLKHGVVRRGQASATCSGSRVGIYTASRDRKFMGMCRERRESPVDVAGSVSTAGMQVHKHLACISTKIGQRYPPGENDVPPLQRKMSRISV